MRAGTTLGEGCREATAVGRRCGEAWLLDRLGRVAARLTNDGKRWRRVDRRLEGGRQSSAEWESRRHINILPTLRTPRTKSPQLSSKRNKISNMFGQKYAMRTVYCIGRGK